MEGQNILYGNVDDLMNVRGLVEARDKVRAEIDSLNNEKRRLEKDVVAEEKQMSINIESTVKKRREQVVSNFDKELDKSQDRLKKVRNDRGKEKNKKVAERIKEETADLVNENKNIILRNIEQGKQAGVNKVSAVFAVSKRDEVRKNMVTDLAVWLISSGYKVSLKDGELEILTIEWE